MNATEHRPLPCQRTASSPPSGCALLEDCFCSEDVHCGPGSECVPGLAFPEYSVCRPAKFKDEL